MRLRRLHRVSAAVVATFVVIHVANHLAGVAGIAAHLAFMQVARTVYRQPAVEALLLACVGFQALSGLWLLIVRRNERQGTVAWAQALSGAYLALFLIIHVGAVMAGRFALSLDTNFYFAAAGLHARPHAYFFAPYYGLAVIAVFTHLGCAARGHVRTLTTRGALLVAIPMLLGAIASSLIVMVLAGNVQGFDMPARYRNIYGTPP